MNDCCAVILDNSSKKRCRLDPFGYEGFYLNMELLDTYSELTKEPDQNEMICDGRELNFEDLIKRCENEMELALAVLKAFCVQGSTSCSALEKALEYGELVNLQLQAVHMTSPSITF